MTDEDIKLARECDSAASVEAGRKMMNDERLLPHGTQSALRAIKAERARTVAWLRGQCKDPMLPEYAEFLGAFADAVERREHDQ